MSDPLCVKTISVTARACLFINHKVVPHGTPDSTPLKSVYMSLYGFKIHIRKIDIYFKYQE